MLSKEEQELLSFYKKDSYRLSFKEYVKKYNTDPEFQEIVKSGAARIHKEERT